MTRRNFIKTAVALAAASVAVPLTTGTEKQYGRIRAGTPQGMRVARCTVNGMEITRFGVDGDDREGWVTCYQWTAYPNPPTPSCTFVRGDRTVKTVTLRGDVRFTMKDA